MTETSTLTLADFILKRIAEDEADALRVEEPVKQGGRLGVITLGEQPAALAISRARVLAECEAHRRIVEDWQSLAERLDDRGRPLHLFDPATSMLLKATEPWIRALALPYADHEDFREEWRA